MTNQIKDKRSQLKLTSDLVVLIILSIIFGIWGLLKFILKW